MRDQQRVHLIAPHFVHELQQTAIDECPHNWLRLFNLPHRLHRVEAECSSLGRKHAEVGIAITREIVQAVGAALQWYGDSRSGLIGRVDAIGANAIPNSSNNGVF
jgi:hypothetical protein